MLMFSYAHDVSDVPAMSGPTWREREISVSRRVNPETTSTFTRRPQPHRQFHNRPTTIQEPHIKTKTLPRSTSQFKPKQPIHRNSTFTPPPHHLPSTCSPSTPRSPKNAHPTSSPRASSTQVPSTTRRDTGPRPPMKKARNTRTSAAAIYTAHLSHCPKDIRALF
jgi:hypothetical protein